MNGARSAFNKLGGVGSRPGKALTLANIEKAHTATLSDGIEELLNREPDRQWRDPIEAVSIYCTGTIRGEVP
jgi:hypothetical protein